MRGRRSTRTRRRLLSSTGAVLGSGLAGCLEGNPGADDPQLGDPEPYVEVELTSADDGHVDPPVVHLVDGGTVEWIVESGTHDVTAYHPSTHGEQRRIPDGAEPWASDDLSDGDSFDQTFDGEGVHDYACTHHERRGAVGSVVVGWPDPDEQPGLGPPADEIPVAASDAIERYNGRVSDVLADVHD